MSLMATLEKSDYMIRLQERRTDILKALSTCGEFIRQFQGGVPHLPSVESFLTTSEGLLGQGEDQEQDMQDITRRMDELERKLGVRDKADKSRPAPSLGADEIRKAVSSAIDERLADLDGAKALLGEVSEAKASIDAAAGNATDEMRKVVRELLGQLDEAGRGIDVSAVLADVEARSREIVAGVAREVVAESLGSAEPRRAEMPAGLEERLDAIETRQDELTERLGAPRPRPVASTFTSSHPRFGEAKASVRALMTGRGQPVRPQEVLDHLGREGFGLDIHPKDVGNRLSAMGFIRVVPAGGKVGKSSWWWTPAAGLPDGFDLR